jgi:hypothetical protein
MISMLCVGVVAAIAVGVIVAKTCASAPAKAQKREKAEIMKQLLALSEPENSILPVAQSRSRTHQTIPAMRPAESGHKPTRRTSQQVRSSKARG